jgi:hypothetical protein
VQSPFDLAAVLVPNVLMGQARHSVFPMPSWNLPGGHAYIILAGKKARGVRKAKVETTKQLF